jgi:hypothetical protein
MLLYYHVNIIHIVINVLINYKLKNVIFVMKILGMLLNFLKFDSCDSFYTTFIIFFLIIVGIVKNVFII